MIIMKKDKSEAILRRQLNAPIAISFAGRPETGA